MTGPLIDLRARGRRRRIAPGNGNSDPVWLLCVEFYVPRWIERVLP